MKRHKPQHHMIFASSILFQLFVGLTLFVVTIAEAHPAPDSAAASATFRTKCAMCHGPTEEALRLVRA